MEPAEAEVSTGTVRAWLGDLGRLVPTDDAGRVEALRALEELKSAAAAAQARITVAFAASQRARQVAAGVPAARVGAGIGAQVALARRDSPARGSRHLGLAQALVDMPHTAAAFTAGQVSEWRVTLAVRETACLSRQDRGVVDAELAGLPGGLCALGDRGTEHACRRIAYRLDPTAFTRRSAQAVTERRVSLRPAPETMCLLTGLLPVAQGVAVHAALTRHADTLRAGGDTRGRGQIMADTLVERVTGQAIPGAVPVEVQLVMTDATLLGQDPTPAHLHGYGPVPAPLVRAWLADTTAAVWVRRLYTRPQTSALVAMDSTRRAFPGGLRRFITVRDQTCRTPWCDAPIRHADHPVRHADGGPTTASNSQGLCAACNLAKEAPGWRAHTGRDGAVHTHTPTGHHHLSPVPRSPVAGPPHPHRQPDRQRHPHPQLDPAARNRRPSRSLLETHLEHLALTG